MRKIIIFIISFLLVYAVNGQTLLTAPVFRNNNADTTYGTHIDTLGVGGMQVFKDTSGRNAIPYALRKQGMEAVTNDSLVYQLQGGITNANWVLVSITPYQLANLYSAANPIWVRKGVVISANYFATAIQPEVLLDSTPVLLTGASRVFKMWYTDSLVGNTFYAESLDGITWVNYSGNPILKDHANPSVFKLGSTYYMFAPDTARSSYTYGKYFRRFDRLTSTDGISWSLTDTAILGTSTFNTTPLGFYNSGILIDSPGVWKMLVDRIGYWKNGQTGGWFNQYYYRSLDSGKTWTQPVTTPVMTGRNITNADIHKINGKYYCWIQETQSSVNTLPTDLWRWVSTDFINWSHSPNQIVLPRRQQDEGVQVNGSSYGGQIADPFLVAVDSTVYLYYSAGSPPNTGSGASEQIKLAIANIPFSKLILTNEGDGNYLLSSQFYTKAYIDSIVKASLNFFVKSGDSASYVNLPQQSKPTAIPSTGITLFDSAARFTVRSSLNKTFSLSTAPMSNNTAIIDSLPNESGTFLMRQDSTDVITGYATQYDFSLAAKDTGVVHRYGTDTIFGAKTISNDLNINSSYRLKFSGTPMVNWRNGYSTVFLGNSGNTTETGINNMAFGVGALQALTSANYNTAIGMNALYSTQSAGLNTAVGYTALYNTIGVNNSGFGYQAGYYNTSGTGNAYLGMASGKYGTTASNNTAVGYAAGSNYTTGGGNTSMGYNAGSNDTTGTYNIAIGYGAGLGNYSGSGNTFIGSNINAISGTGSNYILLGSGISGTVRALFDGVNNYWNFAYPIKPKLSYSSNPTMTSGDYLVLPDKEYTDSLIRVIADSAANTAFVNSAFDTTARSLTMTRNSGGTFSVVIPRGTASGVSGIAVLSSTKSGNNVTVSGDNGTNTTFSINNADSTSRVDSVYLNNTGVIFNTPASYSTRTYSGGLLNTAVITQTLATQSPYTALVRGSGSGSPSFQGSLDSNWIPTLHSLAFYNTQYTQLGFHDTTYLHTIIPFLYDSTTYFYPYKSNPKNYAVTSSGTVNRAAIYSSPTAVAPSVILTDNGTYLGINNTSPAALVDMSAATGSGNGIKIHATGYNPIDRFGINGTVGTQHIWSSNYSFVSGLPDDSSAYYSSGITQDIINGVINLDVWYGKNQGAHKFQIGLTSATLNNPLTMTGTLTVNGIENVSGKVSYFTDPSLGLGDSLVHVDKKYADTKQTGYSALNAIGVLGTGNTGYLFDSANAFRYDSRIDSAHLFRNKFTLVYPIKTVTTGDTILLAQSWHDSIPYINSISGLIPVNSNTDTVAYRSWVLANTTKGTLTSLTQGYGMTLSPSPITTMGSVTVDTTKMIPYTDTLKVNGMATQTWVNSRYQKSLTLTTTGSSGAATLTGSTFNIPNYSGGNPSGNYNDIQINRNGAMATPANDSLAWNSTQLGLQLKGRTSIVAGTNTIVRVINQLGKWIPNEQIYSSPASLTIQTDTVDIVRIDALANSLTFNIPTGSNTFDGQTLIIRIYSAAAQSLAFTTSGTGAFRAGDIPFPTTTTAGKTMYLKFFENAATNTWDFVSYNGNF